MRATCKSRASLLIALPQVSNAQMLSKMIRDAGMQTDFEIFIETTHVINLWLLGDV